MGRRLRRVRIVVSVAVLASVPLSRPGTAAPDPSFKVLVFYKSQSPGHSGTPAALAAVKAMGEEHGFEVTTTIDATQFTDGNLERYESVVWLLTDGEVLDADQQAAFERYIQAGGGFVGVHSPMDTEMAWPWFGDLVGARYAGHPDPVVQQGTLQVADRAHPSTAGMPASWVRTDEWYNFDANPRGDVHILATVDEDTYSGGTAGFDHPIAWCHNFDGGRSWFTVGGDIAPNYSEPLFLEHLLGGILWASGEASGDCGGTVWSGFQKVALDDTTGDPMELDVAPDGRVFFIERAGAVKVFDPSLGHSVLAGTIPVHLGGEDGLLGLALDPGFEQNGWLYLYYADPANGTCAPTDTGATQCGALRLSRFEVSGNELLPLSEKILLETPAQRDANYHAAGSLDFDANGNLFLSTGDNSSWVDADGYAPLDERAGRSGHDAQRTAANTNDLRGKLLRIHPEANGTYGIPSGNLFAPGTPKTRPEIYAMGFRNPFRFAVDPETGWVYLGDYGPDAEEDDPDRGPRAYVEWNLIKSPGNYGWPYCIGNGFPYHDYDYDTQTSAGAFDCDAPTNDSPNNTGLTELPPARPATIWYSYGESEEFPQMGTGCACPMAGPAYHFDPDLDSGRKFPAYYDDTPFFYEFGRNYLKELRLDGGELFQINSFLPASEFRRPIDMTFGPDGAMYLLEWGTNFFGNDDSGLYRIDYVADWRAPSTLAQLQPPHAGPDGRYTTPVEIALDASDDDSGVGRVRFRLDGGDWTTYTGPLTVGGDGVHNLRYRATDQAGNVEPTQTLRIDIASGQQSPQPAVSPDPTDSGGPPGPAPPVLDCTTSPATIGPARHQMVKVTVAVQSAGFTGQPAPVLERVTSSQADSGLRKHDRPHDIKGWAIGTDDRAGRLRAETWRGRVYTLRYSAIDSAGHRAACAAIVSVARHLDGG